LVKETWLPVLLVGALHFHQAIDRDQVAREGGTLLSGDRTRRRLNEEAAKQRNRNVRFGRVHFLPPASLIF
jgi:hypothetical protein